MDEVIERASQARPDLNVQTLLQALLDINRNRAAENVANSLRDSRQNKNEANESVTVS